MFLQKSSIGRFKISILVNPITIIQLRNFFHNPAFLEVPLSIEVDMEAACEQACRKGTASHGSLEAMNGQRLRQKLALCSGGTLEEIKYFTVVDEALATENNINAYNL